MSGHIQLGAISTILMLVDTDYSVFHQILGVDILQFTQALFKIFVEIFFGSFFHLPLSKLKKGYSHDLVRQTVVWTRCHLTDKRDWKYDTFYKRFL